MHLQRSLGRIKLIDLYKLDFKTMFFFMSWQFFLYQSTESFITR
jgi:hypothetical protein